MRFSVFLEPSSWVPKSYGVLSAFVYSWVGQTGWTADALALVLVLIQAILINLLVSNYRLSNESTMFPGLFYILLASALPDFLHLSPVLMANTFYILALLALFDTYKKYTCADTIFNAGFFIGLASLFYFSFLLYIAFVFIGLSILRAFKVKERLQFLVGFSVPYILSMVGYIWTGNLSLFFEDQFGNSVGFLGFLGTLNLSYYAAMIFFSILLLLVLVNYGNFKLKKNIQVQKYISILYWGLLLSGLSLLIQNNIQFDHLLLLVTPMAIFLSFVFIKIKRKQIAEALHFLLVVIVFLFQFKSFWLDKMAI